MSFWRAVLCLIFPPLAVLDYGCGTVLIVAALSMVGWVPGVLAALYVNIEHSSKGR
ncbi:MAG: YqaE/Pmp3 family membrane protein [Armatimonadota bacterium]